MSSTSSSKPPIYDHPSYWAFLWQPTLVYGLNAAIFFYLVIFHYRLPILPFMICQAIGVGLWSLLEYCTHRFLLHWPEKMPKWYPLAKYLHIGHHEDSRDPFVFIIPLPFTLLVYLIIFGVLFALTRRVDVTFAIMLAVMVSYLSFEWFHSYVHLSTSNSAILRWFRQYHYVHHFKDNDRHFGVTTPFWDFVFRTF